MTSPSKIIAFVRVAAPQPPLGEPRRFEGFPRFAREFESRAPLLPHTAAPLAGHASDE